jgi:hypothetical protein
MKKRGKNHHSWEVTNALITFGSEPLWYSADWKGLVQSQYFRGTVERFINPSMMTPAETGFLMGWNQAEVVANTDDCGSHPLISYHCCWLKQFRWCTYPCGLCVCVIIAGGWIASKKILWINVWTCFNPTFLDVDQIPMILTNRRFIFYSPFLLILKLPNQSGKFRYCIWQLDTPIVLWLLDFHDMHDPIDHVNLYLRIFSFWCLYQLTA